jgi:hypothetical protein
LLDLYPAQAALVDGQCNILAVNRAWAQFAACNASFDGCQRSDGQYYLTERVFGALGGNAVAVTSGILSVLRGASETFSYTYQFGSQALRSQFRVTAAPFRPTEDLRWAILLHAEVPNLQVDGSDLVTVCGWCKRLPEGGDWIHFEEYFLQREGVRFSHGICPECRDSVLQEIPISIGARSGV